MKIHGTARRIARNHPAFLPLFRALNFSFLENDASFPDMANFWILARDGASAATAPSFRGAAAAAGFPEIPPDNSEMSTGAVTCDDVAWPTDVEQYRKELANDEKNYPLFAQLGSEIWGCAFWRVAPVEPPVALNPNGPPNSILILNTLRDNATPLPGAQRMRQLFGQRARLVLVDGGGHAIFGLMDNICATNTVASYLADGIYPPADMTCPANPPSGAPVTNAAPSPERGQAIRAIRRQMLPIHR